MDFKTQRKAVSAVENFGKKTIIFYPVCILIKLFITAFCSIARAVDMALSDDNGRFLGLNRRCSRREKAERIKEKKIRRTEEKVRRKAEVRHQKRGFIRRTLSAALSFAFAFMTMPAGLEIVTFAAVGDSIGAAVESQLILETTYEQKQKVDAGGNPMTDPDGKPIMENDLDKPLYTTFKGFNATATSGCAVYSDTGSWTRVDNGGYAISGVENLKAIDLTKTTYIGANAFSGARNLKAIVVDCGKLPAEVFSTAFDGIDPSCVLYILNSTGNTNVLNGFPSGNRRVCLNTAGMTARDVIGGIIECAEVTPGTAEFNQFTYPIGDADSSDQKAQLFVSFSMNNTTYFDGAIIRYNDNIYDCARVVTNNNQILLAEDNAGKFTAIIPLGQHSTTPGVHITPYKNLGDGTATGFITDIYGESVKNFGAEVTVTQQNFSDASRPHSTLYVPNTGDQQPFLRFSGLPDAPASGSDHMKYYVCFYYGGGTSNDFILLTKTGRNIPDYTLPGLANNSYTPYLLEVFDPLGNVTTDSLKSSVNVSNAIMGMDENWQECENFSFRITKAKLDLEEVKNVTVQRNGDCADTITFTWTASNKATGCYFYRYNANGEIIGTYKYENPEPSNPAENQISRVSAGNETYRYTFKLGDTTATVDRGIIAPDDDVIYYDIVPYEKLPYSDEDYIGEKYVNGANNGEHQIVYADHYILRTVSNFSKLRANEEPWIQLFWKEPALSASHSDYVYESGNNFIIRCFDADGNAVDLGTTGNVNVIKDPNGEYNAKFYMNNPSLRTDTDYYFTVSVTGFSESRGTHHYFTSCPAYAKAKNKPNHVGYPGGANDSSSREQIALTKGNTEFDVTWPQVQGGADAYRIDVYNVEQREASLYDLDTKVANAPQMHVHSQVYPVTMDALYGALTVENLIESENIGGTEYFTVTIDRLNLLGGAYVRNGSSYMVVITAIKYGIGMNFNPVQMGDIVQIPVEAVNASSPEDYAYKNKYHYKIESERVLSSDVVVPENVLIMKKPHWYFDDKHIIRDRGVLLEWKTGNTNGVDGYIIERYVSDVNTPYVPSNAKWEEIGTVEGASTNFFVDTDYETFYKNNIANNNETRYWYRITPTYQKTATYATSAAVYFDLTPDVFKITPPTPVWSQGVDGSILIEWDRDPLNNADAYNIYKPDGTLYVNVHVPESTDPDTGVSHFKFVDKNLDFDTLKRYTISSVYYAEAVDHIEYPPSSTRVLFESEKVPVTGVSGILRAPLNLEGVCDKDGNITLTWTGVSSAEYYNVYYSVNNGRYTKVSVPPTQLTTSNLNYKVFNNLSKGDVYKFYVKSAKNISVNGTNPYNKEAESDPTNELTMVVGVAVDTPTLKATPGDRRVTLEWSNVADADGYELYACDANGTNLKLLTSSPDVSYTDTGLTNNQNYYYVVRAYKYINGIPVYSTFSQVVSARTDVLLGDGEGDPRYLAAPVDFVVNTGDGAAELSWTEVDGAEGYRVYMINYAGDYQLLGVTSKSSITYTGLTNGETYTYTVTAYKTLPDGEIVESTYAIPRSVTVGNYIAAPLDLVAVAGNRTVTLSWTAVPGATGYVVYAYSAASGSFTAIGAVSQPGFVHDNLENGLTYTYMVTAYKQVGLSNQYSNYSIAVSAVPSADAATGTGTGTGTGNNNNNNNNNPAAGGTNSAATVINIVGTLPSGISHSELISAYTDEFAFTQDIDIRFSIDTESSKIIYDTLAGYAEGLDSFDVYPFDISTYIAGTNTKIQPVSGHYLTITMPIPDSFRKYGENMQVMHVKNDGQMEILPLTFGESGGIPLVQFSCAEFSPFAFVHYYTAEDIRSGSGAAAAGGSGTVAGSAYSMRFTSCGGFILRKRNRIYKLIRK